MRRNINKTMAFILTVIMLFSAVSIGSYAASVSVNAKEIDLYFISASDSGLKLPKEYKSSFQLKVTGAANVSYYVKSGDSATVSSKGLVKPASTTYYWYGFIGTTQKIDGEEPDSVSIEYEPGDSVIGITADSKTYEVKVHVHSYDDIYVDNVMNDYIKKNIKSSMSDYEKLCKVAQFVASYDYSTYYSSARSMIIYGGGDCWASTDAVIQMSKKLGFDAWERNGNRDVNAGSGHMNAMVKTSDGEYYEIDAGYDGKAPRYYNIDKRTSLFSYNFYSDNGIEVYQYDGKSTPKNLTVPKKIDGYTVRSIGENFLVSDENVKSVTLPETVEHIGDSAFNSCVNLETINLPSALVSLDNFVFTNCNKLTNIINNSDNFNVYDGGIYNKDMSTLLYVPSASKFSIKSGVKTVAYYAFYYNTNLKSVTVPKTVESFGEGAFGNCESLNKVTISGSGLKTVGDFAFANCYALKKLTLPESVESMGESVFWNIEDSILLYGSKTGVVADHAKDNNILYNHTHEYTSKITKKATCTSKGVRTYTCDCGYSYTKSIDAKGHSYKTTTTKATTSKSGSIVSKCKNCGKVKSKTTIAKISSIKLSHTTFTYNGNVKKPTVTVKDSKGNKLKEGTDYTVKYSSGRKNVGKYTVTVTFKGNYSGKKTLSFKINPKSTSISKLTAGSKKFTATWKKQSTQTTGYQLQYSTSSSMKNATTKTYSNVSKTSQTVSGLKAVTKYYVRVRTYKNVKIDGETTKFYSSWSSVKSIKTK